MANKARGFRGYDPLSASTTMRIVKPARTDLSPFQVVLIPIGVVNFEKVDELSNIQPDSQSYHVLTTMLRAKKFLFVFIYTRAQDSDSCGSN